MRLSASDIAYTIAPSLCTRAWKLTSRHPGTKLLNNTTWAFAATGVVRALNIGVLMALSRTLGPTGVGQFGLVQSTVAALGVTMGSAMGLACTKYVAELRDNDRTKLGRLISTAYVMTLVWIALGVIVLTVGNGVLIATGLATPDMTGALQIGALLLAASTFSAIQIGILAGFEAYHAVARANAISSLISFGLALWGSREAGLNGALLGFTIGVAASCILGHRAIARSIRLFGMTDYLTRPSEWKHLALFALPSALSNTLLGSLLWQCNAWLAATPAGMSELACFLVADKWRQALVLAPSVLAHTSLPLLTRARNSKRPDEANKMVRTSVLWSAILTAVPVILLVILARPAMSIFGSGFDSNLIVLRTLAISALPTVINTALGQALLAKGSVYSRLAFDVLFAAALAMLALYLIPSHGAQGLAYAYLLSFLLTTAALAAYFAFRYRRSTYSTC